jgi:hypothetical protein
MIETWAILATAAVAAFAIGAFIAVEQERKEALDEDARNWEKSNNLFYYTQYLVDKDRAERKQ